MILPIVVYGNPILRKISEPIDASYPNLKQLISDMFDTMNKAEGVGLAAPQVGLNIRLFVIDATAMAEDRPEMKGFRRVFINPEIVEEWGNEWAYNEGCLSVPSVREDVMRKQNIRMKYMDENLQEHEEVFDGVKARIIQHEYDHLQGKLLVDKLSALRRRLVSGKLTNIQKGKFRTDYRTK